MRLNVPFMFSPAYIIPAVLGHHYGRVTAYNIMSLSSMDVANGTLKRNVTDEAAFSDRQRPWFPSGGFSRLWTRGCNNTIFRLRFSLKESLLS